MLTEAASAINRCTLLAQHMQELSHMAVRQPEKVCVNDVISGMAGTLYCLAGGDAELIITCAPDVGLVHAVPQEIERILLNLVVNACQAITGTGTIALATSNTQADHGAGKETGSAPYVTISVSDDGTGMDEETRARLFEPFFTTREDGTGLGLAIVQDIVARSRGHVQVESEPGQGTTFRVLLPRIDSGETAGRYTRA
jgi:signal transduction histidine kinase